MHARHPSGCDLAISSNSAVLQSRGLLQHAAMLQVNLQIEQAPGMNPHLKQLVSELLLHGMKRVAVAVVSAAGWACPTACQRNGGVIGAWLNGPKQGLPEVGVEWKALTRRGGLAVGTWCCGVECYMRNAVKTGRNLRGWWAQDVVQLHGVVMLRFNVLRGALALAVTAVIAVIPCSFGIAAASGCNGGARASVLS